MATEQVAFASRPNNTSQVTGRFVVLAAQVAADEGCHDEAKRLLTIAHELFAQQLSPNYVSIDWIEDADDR